MESPQSLPLTADFGELDMKKSREWIVWCLAAAVAVGILAWGYPQAFPLQPQAWTSSRAEATALARERFTEFGEVVEDPFVAVELRDDVLLDHRLNLAHQEGTLTTAAAAPLVREIRTWRVSMYEPGARPGAWKYRAMVDLQGELVSLWMRVPEEKEGESIEEGTARQRADAFLERMGFDLDRYGEPKLRRTDRLARTDLFFRYEDRAAVLGDALPYGVEVGFAGERLAGFRPWSEDPDREALITNLETVSFWNTAWITMPFLLFPFVAFFFLRKYHAGEVGVRRGVQVFLVTWVCGVATMVLSAKHASEGTLFSALNRAQVPWAWGFQMSVLWFSALALVAALSWTVGEARCRTHWGQKLAAFDALFQRRWHNGTVARAALRGLAASAVVAATVVLALVVLRQVGVWAGLSSQLGPWWHHAPWPGLSAFVNVMAFRLYAELFCMLFLLPVAVRRLGTWGGGLAVALVAGVIFFPTMLVEPLGFMIALSVLRTAMLLAMFLRYDLLSALLASIGSSLILNLLPFLFADHPAVWWQGVFPLFLVAAPLALSFRSLGSDKEFKYRYEDIPPHVRRITERERQRVELETARGIQSSILPDLPSQLAGIELAHAYLPATEVGGDFYDVLDLEDGRLAVAVGDVAGHGVSSGLVMSMAKSTLALQVTVNPEAEVVLSTLNRMVYRSARLRLLTTLCYALVDRDRRELTYASAGHLAPYRIDAEGRVEGLAASSYPLGVRDRLDVQVRTVKLSGGDHLFLYSDGVVEARSENDDELFGFERLESSLARHADKGPRGLRDGVLGDLAAFTGKVPQEDDQTIVVLRVP